jgi:hypothetical protein
MKKISTVAVKQNRKSSEQKPAVPVEPATVSSVSGSNKRNAELRMRLIVARPTVETRP